MKSLYNFFHMLSNGNNPLSLPFVYSDNDVDYYDFVHSKVESYLSELKTLGKNSINDLNSSLSTLPEGKVLSRELDILSDAFSVWEMVSKVINLSYKGLFSEAFLSLENFFTADNSHNAELLPQLSIHGRQLFRVRNGTVTNEQGEMFHLPFDAKRYFAKSERYSTAGYPCLYLAGSLFTAWMETDSSTGELTYVKYKIKDEYRNKYFLDLGYPLSPNPSLIEMYSLLMYYPLIIACSVSVLRPDCEYRPEYIMPQMMLEFLRYHSIGGPSGIIGISYPSTKNKIDSLYSFWRRNFVIPTKGADSFAGYDLELAKTFQMSKFNYLKGSNLQDVYSQYSLGSLVEGSLVKDEQFYNITLQ